MNLFSELLFLISEHLIKGIFISVLVIIGAKVLSGNKIETEISKQILRWIIVSYSLGTLHNFILSLIISDPNNYKFFDRLTGPYWWAYWMMLNTTSALPLILLKNKFGRNLYLILLVGLLMNIGWIFESMVIHATSIHREYTIEYYYHYLPYSRERIILMKGLILGLIALLIENIVKKWPVRNKE